LSSRTRSSAIGPNAKGVDAVRAALARLFTGFTVQPHRRLSPANRVLSPVVLGGYADEAYPSTTT
jgi:hypothetical protein